MVVGSGGEPKLVTGASNERTTETRATDTVKRIITKCSEDRKKHNLRRMGGGKDLGARATSLIEHRRRNLYIHDV